MSELRFDGRVAIVTGAGNGLGRAHALLLGLRGAKVVVNDLGGSMHGGGRDHSAAEKVVAEIRAAGGEAIANADSVEDGARIVEAALDTWKRVDIVVNNAGILRDTSFQKMTDEDWDLIYRVHVLGSYKVTKAAWNAMRDAKFGRIVMTASAAGIYGNFGQANYAMAKMGLIGFAQTLALEGRKHNVFCNTIAPIAGSRLTETVLPKELVDALKPEVVSPLVAYLCHEQCQETGATFEVGGGFMAKLRWERSTGKLYPNGRPISVETVAKDWRAITSFETTTHPENIAESMQPVIDNAQKKSRGGNDLIDVDQALGFEFPPFQTSYDERDLSLYALSIGAGQNPTDPHELSYIYEMASSGFKPFPTYAVTPVLKGILEAAKRGEQAPGLNYGFERILHGEQFTRLERPLPAKATLTHRSKIRDIWDKGKNGVVVVETKSFDEKGALVAENEITMVVRGAGGWGGERGPSGEANAPPNRAPDHVTEQHIDPQQALLYRLNGDWNPLHADPDFAKAFGFDRPILHGLCTFGYAARHAINAFAGGDARLFRSIRARFADSVFPGETLRTEMWKEGDRVIVVAKIKERDKVVLSNAAIELFREVPKPAPEAPAKTAEASKAEASPQNAAPKGDLTSADIVAVIADYIGKNPDLAAQIKTTFQFRLASPASAFGIDLKNGKGSVCSGSIESPDVTLDLTDEDFLSMTTGKADAQKLYFAGKLKIGGNVMASQKLMFLKNIDPKSAAAVIEKSRSSAPAETKKSAATEAPTHRERWIEALGARLASEPGLGKELGAVVALTIDGKTWRLDGTQNPATLTVGDAAGAAAHLTLPDEELASASKLGSFRDGYQRGKIRVDGDVKLASRIQFLKGLLG